MAVARGTDRRRYVLVLVLLSAATLITLDQRGQGSEAFDGARRMALDAVAPIQSAIDDVITPAADWVDGVTSAGSLRRERDELRHQLENVESELARAQGALDENEDLRRQLDLRLSGLELDGVTTEVIARSPTSFERTLTISKGTDQGIAEGMPVVAGDGLVGRVTLAGRTSAKVLLITDASSGVSVRLGTETGSADGAAGRDTLAVNFIDPEAQVEDGEVAVTLGEMSRFPPGIPVGTVIEAEPEPGEVQQRIRLEPIVDLAQVEIVTVLIWPAS